MIIITGSITARPDGLAELRKISLEHVHRSRLESGCLSHDVHVDLENELRSGVSLGVKSKLSC